MNEEPPILDEILLDVQDGELTGSGSWVYVWQRATPRAPKVIYVGATGLPPAARAWLHLHHDDPAIGRIRAERPEALDGRLIVRAFRLDPQLDRQQVKLAVEALLQGASRSASASDEAWSAAEALVARLGV